MAILENETSNYFKVDLTKSFIQKNIVFAAITVYGSDADRQIEKNRIHEFMLFDENCELILQELSQNEQNEELYTIFSHSVQYIKDNRYTKDRLTINDIVFPEEVMNLLLQCGYKWEWIRIPIFIVSERLINCGTNNGETLSTEYLYNKLKTKMAINIRDI